MVSKITSHYFNTTAAVRTLETIPPSTMTIKFHTYSIITLTNLYFINTDKTQHIHLRHNKNNDSNINTKQSLKKTLQKYDEEKYLLNSII